MQTGELIKRFFIEAKKHLKKDGVIIMPYFHLAGAINNPQIQAPKFGYKVVERFSMDIREGLQQGLASIYEITLI